MAKAYFLTEADRQKIIDGLAKVMRLRVNNGTVTLEQLTNPAPEVLIAKVKGCKGIPPSTGGKPGSAMCTIHKLVRVEVADKDREYEPVTRPDGKPMQRRVYNIYPQRFRNNGYFLIYRNKFGGWVCERPEANAPLDGGSCSSSSSSDSDSSDSSDGPCPVDRLGAIKLEDIPLVDADELEAVFGRTADGCGAFALLKDCDGEDEESGSGI